MSFSKLKLTVKTFAGVNPLRANPRKWSNTLKQFVDNLPTNCLSVFEHFVGLALKGLTKSFTQSLRFFYGLHMSFGKLKSTSKNSSG